MGRRQGRTTRFRIGDPATVVSCVPPGALYARCFGFAAGEAFSADGLSGVASFRDASAGDLPPVPLRPVAGDRDFRLPDQLEGEALHSALEILVRAETLADCDRVAAATVVDAPAMDKPTRLVERTVSQTSLTKLVQRDVGLPGWWTLPGVRVVFVNAPDASAWRARIACPSESAMDRIAATAVETVENALDAGVALGDLVSSMPRDLSTFCLPPHGVLTRVEYARADGAYWLRSAATRLRQMMDDALLALPVGSRHRDADGASTWTGTFSSRPGLAGGTARLGAWGRPAVASIEFQGPFRPDLGPATIALTPKATAEPILDVFALLPEASR